MFKPNLIAMAILTDSSSRRKPHEEIGKVKSQSPEWRTPAALKTAISLSLDRQETTSFLDLVKTGLIQADCLEASANVGREPYAADHLSLISRASSTKSS